MRKSLRAMSVVFVMCLAFAAHGSANVFDDAVFWFRGGKDCVKVDGYMQTGEFFDDLHANDTNHVNHKMPMTSYTGNYGGFKENVAFINESVVFPALGTDVAKSMQVLHISNVGKKNTDKKTYYYPPVVSPHCIFDSNKISNKYTIVTRVKLDNYDRTECLFRIGYNGSEKQGMMLGFEKRNNFYSGCKGLMAYCTPDSDGSSAKFQFDDLPVPTNTWVDIAVVVGDGNLRVGIATPVSLPRHSNNPTIAFAQTRMWTDNCPLLSSDRYFLFGQNNLSAPKEDVNSTFYFTGSVQQMAIWGRALSDQEVMAAFGMPRPTIFRTGFDNGSSNEFGGERSGSSQTIDGLGSWQDVSDTMLAGDEWTVNFNALRDEAGLPQIFSIKSLSDSAAAQIEPILNTTSLKERRVAENGRTFWPVPQDLIVEGANTLIIKRKDGGAGTFKMDAMELGGSLGVGTEADSTDDGRTPPDRTAKGVPSAADPNLQHWPKELQPSLGVTNLRFRVWVDPDVVNMASFKFRTRTQLEARSGETLHGDEKFTLFVNGEKEDDHGTDTEIEPINLDFAPGELIGGWNIFELKSAPPYDTCRWHVGYYRFETILSRGFSLPPPGMAVIIR